MKYLNNEKIENAKQSLVEFLGDIKGKTFVDIGCGSGLFSLAAYLLGAEKVVSTDIDDYSLWCTNRLKKKFKGDVNWIVKKGSALDGKFLRSLGKYDIVYSWGVLHHTGKMWSAVEKVSKLVNLGGVYFLALYNENPCPLEGPSWLWVKLKKFHNSSNRLTKKIMHAAYLSYLVAGITAHGINPYKYIKNYKTNRGMNFLTDVKDWLGGYPYEYAAPKEVKQFVEKLGFKQIKSKNARSLGCNEFLFKKEEAS